MSDDMNEADARRLAEAVGDRLTQVLNPLAKTLERMNERLDAVDRRVVFLEANHHRPEIDALRTALEKAETEIEALTAWRNQMAGAATLFSWVRSSWPFVVGAMAALVTWLKIRGDAP